ncbi:MAG: hypothetical protein ACXWC9_10095 [Pseudobdellovibrionaceae bacterium]
MNFLLSLGFVGLITISAQAQTAEQRLSEVEKRLEDLELRHSEFHAQSLEGRGQVRSFFTNAITFGGFFENAITNIEGPDTESQTSANSQLLGLNIAADMTENFRFVSQILTGLSYSFQNPHHNPTLTPDKRQYGTLTFGAIVAQGYVEYLHSAGFRMQTGLGYAPFGYAIQQREIVLFKRRSGPQLANSSGSGSVGIAFPLWTGVHVLGSFPIEDHRWGYNLYSFSPFGNPKSLGVGSRLWWQSSTQTTIGISSQSGDDRDHKFNSYGVDINTKNGRFGLTAEYARTPVRGLDLVTESYYTEPFVTFYHDTVVIYAVADYFNNETYTSIRGGAVVTDPYERWSTGGGINWLPIPAVRLRLGYLVHNYIGDTAVISDQNRDYQSADFSVGVTF